MPRDIAVLAHLFPVLQRIPVVAEAPRARLQNLDEQQVRTRAFAALRELLLQIGDRTPVVMFIDDLQWGDADSAQVMFEVLRPPEAPVVLFMGNFRSDEAGDSPFLHEWKELPRRHGIELPSREVKVGPLTVEECTKLVIAVKGKDNDVIRKRARQFAEETRGNPYLLTELIGCFDAEADSFEPLPMNEVIAQKLERLPNDAARLLEVVAVSGQALAVEEAFRSSGYDGEAISTITQMRNERLVRMIGGDDNPLVDTYHDRIQETVLAEMSAERQRQTHLELARQIELQGAVSEQWIEQLTSSAGVEEADFLPRAYDLAYHYDAAGEKCKAWIYGLLAAEQAKRQFAIGVAAEQYAISERNLENASAAIHYRIAAGWGETLMLLGRYDQATQKLEGAVELRDEDEEKSHIESLQGELTFKQGQIDKSIETLESRLRRLGAWVPRSRIGSYCGVMRESFIQCLHSLIPRLRHTKSATNRRQLIVHFANCLSQVYMFQTRSERYGRTRWPSIGPK